MRGEFIGNRAGNQARAFPGRAACGLLFGLLLSGPGLADVSGELESEEDMAPLYVRAGTYFLDSRTTARVNGAGGNFGSRLSFEDDLNLDKRKETLLAGIRWRFADRHHLELEYFDLKRFGSTRIDEEIRFGDRVFPIGADIDSSFSTEVTRLSYTYRLIRKKDWGLGFSAGLHVTRLKTSLTSIKFDNIGIPIVDREIASVTAPLPVLGFGGARRLSEKWSLVARGQWFFLEADDVKGHTGHAAAYLEHNTFERVGFGIGYDWFEVDVDTSDRFWKGSVDVEFRGPLLFVQAIF